MPRVYHRRDAPPGAVYVGRGTPYGNPYKEGQILTREQATALGNSKRLGQFATRGDAIRLFELLVLPALGVEPLRGKDLSCSCKPKACHGDPILKKANR